MKNKGEFFKGLTKEEYEQAVFKRNKRSQERLWQA